MFIDRLLNQGSAPALEQMLRFTAARHKLIAQNIVNVDTPGYKQQDLSLEKFQNLLAERVDQKRESAPGSVRFDDIGMQAEFAKRGILFHDGNNRTMEQMMTDEAKNAMMHNLAVELLRKQFESMEMALRERVG